MGVELLKPEMQFALLKLVEFTGRYKLEKLGNRGTKKQQIWKCKCTCGNVIEAHARQLRERTKKSCGCKKLIANTQEDPFNVKWSNE